MRPTVYVLTFAFSVIPVLNASAICFFPSTDGSGYTDVSGYKVPLAEELKSSPAIAIGTVLSVEALSEDQSEPEFPTAYIYTVRVSRLLKGALPRNIQLRAENDSGGYRMTVGEQHILFLQKEGDHFIADDCGNSAVLPQGNEILRKTEEELSGGANAP